jgi:hypothetical protein
MCTLISLVASICLNWEYRQTVVLRIYIVVKSPFQLSAQQQINAPVQAQEQM